MIWLECIVVCLVAVAATVLLVPLAKRIAAYFDAIDYPSARRVNMRPVPRMGGIALLGGLIAAFLVMILGIQLAWWPNPFAAHSEAPINYVGVVLGVLVMFGVGAVDDVVDLKPKSKFIGQIIAACIVAASGVLLSEIRNPFGSGFIEFGWVSYPITVFYLVAFANVINLIDGLDGLAAGITAISSATIFVFSVLTGRPDSAIMSLALMGVCIGFLRYNFNPASIFMGDSGALLLGFSLGIISLFAVARSALVLSLLVPILAAGVPITDTALAIIRRKRSHRPVDEADKGHIHHRLLQAGFTQKATVLIMWTWTAALALCAVLVTEFDGAARIIIILIVVAITAYGIIKLRLLQPVLLHHYSPRGKRTNRQNTAQSSQLAQSNHLSISKRDNSDQPSQETSLKAKKSFWKHAAVNADGEQENKQNSARSSKQKAMKRRRTRK